MRLCFSLTAFSFPESLHHSWADVRAELLTETVTGSPASVPVAVSTLTQSLLVLFQNKVSY